MHRIVEIIAQVCASGPGMTLRAAADVALGALVGQFPGVGAMLVECAPGGARTARVVASIDAAARHYVRRIPLAAVPLIAAAAEAPERTVQGEGRLLVRVDGRSAPAHIVCGAVPPLDEAVHVFVVYGASTADLPVLIEAVDVVRRLLAWSPPPAGKRRSRVLAAIVDAKREWERTADALPELVGLIDRSRRVVRVNRTVERWSLGTVQDAIGRNIHELLHPRCTRADCELESLLDGAFQTLDSAPTASFELADRECDMDLVVALNTTADASGKARGRSWKSAALIVSNVTSLRQAERDLRSLNRALEQRVADRTARLTGINRELREEIARRRRAEESLRESKLELEALSDRLVSAQEEERKRIAQDLHDSVGQGMSAIKYTLERASVLAHRGQPDQAVRVVDNAIERTQGVIDEVRAISMNLRPAVLDDLGAVSAIRSLCRDWHDVYNSVAVRTDITVADKDIPSAIVTNVYRAVQESLNNVARHAQAQRVWISMRIAGGKLVVEVRDDGLGFHADQDPREPQGRPTLLGLRGLRERTERSGGCCKVKSAPGRGTTVHLEWPVEISVPLCEASVRLN